MLTLFDNAASLAATTASLSFPHTCAGSDRAIFVGFWSNGTVSSVTYGGQALSLGANSTTQGGFSWYKLLNPPLGTNNVVITFTGTVFCVGLSLSYTGVKQTGFPNVQNNGSTTPATNTSSNSVTTTQPNCWHVGFCLISSGTADQPTAGAGTTRRVQRTQPLGVDVAAFDSNGPVVIPGVSTLNFASTVSVNHHGISKPPQYEFCFRAGARASSSR